MRKARHNDKSRGDFDQKLIDLRRVTRVVAGGKRFSFRSTLIIGDHRGTVGVGVGKGADTALSIEKAFREAKKHAIKVLLTNKGSIPHETEAKFKAARILIKPTAQGKGLVAGGAARIVLGFAGVQNVTAKILSHTKNKITIAMVTIAALKKLKLKSGQETKGQENKTENANDSASPNKIQN